MLLKPTSFRTRRVITLHSLPGTSEQKVTFQKGQPKRYLGYTTENNLDSSFANPNCHRVALEQVFFEHQVKLFLSRFAHWYFNHSADYL